MLVCDDYCDDVVLLKNSDAMFRECDMFEHHSEYAGEPLEPRKGGMIAA